MRNRSSSSSPCAGCFLRRATSCPPFFSITRIEAVFPGSVVRSTMVRPVRRASGKSAPRAAVARPSRLRHGTTAYPIWPRQVGGRALVPCCHLSSILPQKPLFQIQRRKLGRRFRKLPSGNWISAPRASGSSRDAMKPSGSKEIACSSSVAASGRVVRGDHPVSSAARYAARYSNEGVTRCIQRYFSMKASISSARMSGKAAL